MEDTPAGYYLVADTAFPRGSKNLKGRIEAPLKSRQHVTGTEAQINERMLFDCELLSYRQTAEWGMRALQGCFGRLRVPLDIGDAQARSDLLEICVRLHNLRAELCNINQIRTVYFNDTMEKNIWNHFEAMLFGDQRKNDRVTRFHTMAVYD